MRFDLLMRSGWKLMYLIVASYRQLVTWPNVLQGLDHLELFSRFVVVQIFVSVFLGNNLSIVTYSHILFYLFIYFLYQAKCLETGETVAIKKVLQDRRYKNRELQLMRVMDHPNVLSLKHCFFSTTSKNELFLNLVMEYVPETMYRVLKHYSNANQRMPLIYVKLYMYQVRIMRIMLTLVVYILCIHSFS